MAASATDTPITGLLAEWNAGSADAWKELLPGVYRELRRVAACQLHRERPGVTLQATELVHEAWIRLADEQRIHWQGRSHFFGIAGRLMRQVLIQRARARSAMKRGGGQFRLPLDEDMPVTGAESRPLADLADAMDELAREDPRKAAIVELRYFAGLTHEEIARELKVSLSTIERDMRMALPWLRRRMASAA